MEQQSETQNTNPTLYFGGILLGLIGLVLSIYATMHHIELKTTGATDAACNINQVVSCDEVAKSQFSEVFGQPLGILGAGFFAGLILLLGVAYTKEDYRKDNLQTYALMAALGVLSSVALLVLSMTSVGAVCPTCIGVYVVCFLQAGLVFINRKDLPAGFNMKGLSNGLTYPIVTVAVGAIAYSYFLKPPPSNITQDLPQVDFGANTPPPSAVLDPTKHDIPLSRSAYSGLGEDYRIGPDNAKVTIIEFADYQCPACRHAFNMLKRVKAEFGNQVQVVFRNFPLDNACNPQINRKLHESACDAAVLTRCAGRKGHFWKLHDQIFSRQSEISKPKLTEWAKGVGLTDAEIAECRQSKDILEKIREDISIGNKIGVEGTPSIYVNGQKVIDGRSADAMKNLIHKMLNE